MRSLLLAAAGLVIIALDGAVARGEILGYSFAGQITTNNSSSVFPSIGLGDAFTGSFKYDTSVVGAPLATGVVENVYQFPHALPFLGVSFTVNGQTFQGDANGAYSAFNFDNFGVDVRDTSSFEQAALTPPGFSPEEMSVRVELAALVTVTSDPIGDPTVLPTLLQISDWDTTTVVFRIVRDGIDPRITGTIDSLEAVQFGDLDGDGILTAADIDALSAAIHESRVDPLLDLDHNGVVDADDRIAWVSGADYANTYFGDANLDGEFNSADLVAVFTAGQYEDGLAANSGWSTGDWDGDAEFSSGDIVTAFQGGGYELGPRPGLWVPEPLGLLPMMCGILPLVLPCRRRWI